MLISCYFLIVITYINTYYFTASFLDYLQKYYHVLIGFACSAESSVS